MGLEFAGRCDQHLAPRRARAGRWTIRTLGDLGIVGVDRVVHTLQFSQAIRTQIVGDRAYAGEWRSRVRRRQPVSLGDGSRVSVDLGLLHVRPIGSHGESVSNRLALIALLSAVVNGCGGYATLSGVRTKDGGIQWPASALQLSVTRNGQRISVHEHMELMRGDKIQTGSALFVKLTIEDAEATLYPNTTVELASWFPEIGKAWIRGLLHIRTKYAAARVKGTEYVVDVDGEHTTRISVISGHVAVTANEGNGPEIVVGARQQATVTDVATAPELSTLSPQQYQELLKDIRATEEPSAKPTMPDLSNLSETDAAALLQELGVRVKWERVLATRVEDIDRVVSQEPRAGEQISLATVRVARNPSSDPDRDGFVGLLDKCPTQAEDENGVEDEDGCPDATPQSNEKRIAEAMESLLPALQTCARDHSAYGSFTAHVTVGTPNVVRISWTGLYWSSSDSAGQKCIAQVLSLANLGFLARGVEFNHSFSLPHPNAEQMIVDLNKGAMEAYNNMDINKGGSMLEEALRVAFQSGISKGPLLAQTNMNLAIVYIGGLADNDGGVRYFADALCADPSAQLDPLNSAPDIQNVMQVAAARVQQQGCPGKSGVAP
jgi:hypothetical protein